MRPKLPTAAMIWSKLPAPTRRRIAVLLGHLARHPLASTPIRDDAVRDRCPSREEGHDNSSEKVQGRHRDRLAVVYVRQSTLRQVEQHQELTRLQYALVERALRLGWARERVEVIDDDLGRSGASAANRPGFQRLVAEVGLNHVGLVLGIEMSRLARSCRDWHQLLEICALFDTLIADTDGVYDAGLFNDRLLLGLKGTMSEAELHMLKARMLDGRRAKAQRGELFFNLPRGYVRGRAGGIVLDSDEQVQATVRLVFDTFERRHTINGVLSYLVAHNIDLPFVHAPERQRESWNGIRRTAIRSRRCCKVRFMLGPMPMGAVATDAAGRLDSVVPTAWLLTRGCCSKGACPLTLTGKPTSGICNRWQPIAVRIAAFPAAARLSLRGWSSAVAVASGWRHSIRTAVASSVTRAPALR